MAAAALEACASTTTAQRAEPPTPTPHLTAQNCRLCRPMLAPCRPQLLRLAQLRPCSAMAVRCHQLQRRHARSHIVRSARRSAAWGRERRCYAWPLPRRCELLAAEASRAVLASAAAKGRTSESSPCASSAAASASSASDRESADWGVLKCVTT